MATLRKFGLLLWKNYILQKRHKIQTVMEILVPVFFTGLLVLIRFLVNSEVISNVTRFNAFEAGSPLLSDYIGDQLTNDTKFAPYLFNEIVYYPKNSLTIKAMENIRTMYFNETFMTGDNFPRNITYTFKGFSTEQEMVDYYLERSRVVLAGISFRNMASDANEFKEDIHYELRFSSKQRTPPRTGELKWNTEFMYPLFQVLGPRRKEANYGGVPFYYREGFIYLQHAIDREITREVISETNFDYETITLQRFPYPPYIDDVFLVALQGWLPLIFILSFIYPCINITKSIVYEKEKRLKESMKIMGLPNYLHWSAWYLKSIVFLLLSIILMTVLMKIRFFQDGSLGVITYGDATLLFLFLLSFTFTVISLSFFISTLFSTANSASTAAGVIFFLTYFPYFFLQPRYSELEVSTKLGVSILSNTGMAFGCQVIAMFEGTGAGIQWNTINSGASPDDTFTMLDCLIMMWVDSILYLVLAWYIEGVRPGDYGVPLPWYFPFTLWYWLGTEKAVKQSFAASALNNNTDEVFFEPEPRNSKAGIQIKSLTKIFKKKTAVNSLSLNMYENQITALLGHNGAGKTTTMSMLIGLFPPTYGTALMNGFDIRQEIQSVRGSLGICPQHDVLFDELTCQEHLEFFGQMKGMTKDKIPAEINRLLKALNLEPKRHAQAQTLSGGMKRKLSVAIALCGGSKVVLLDEPTSGMDPGARRSTWDLLQSEKKNRTLVLSTHFMEEADVLGDRIAIMAEGKVRCCGSSLFLKKRYGGGYHLVMVKESNCDVDKITQLLQKTVPDVRIDQNIGGELSYSLPDNKSHFFPDMFQELETRKRELGIASYGASITTMEEVFMKVGKEAEAHDHFEDPTRSTQISIETLQQNSAGYRLYEKQTKNTGFTLLIQQLRAMIVKKLLYAVRNRILLVFQTIIPIFFLIITLVVVETLPGIQEAPSLDFNIEGYTIAGPQVTLMRCNENNPIDPVCNSYKEFAGSSFRQIDSGTFEDYVISEAQKDLSTFNYRHIVGMESNQTSSYNAYFNAQPFHGAPTALNFITNAILRKSKNGNSHKIITSNYPFPMTTTEKANQAGSFESSGFQVGFNIAFGMAFLASSFVVFLIKERESKAKHLQFVSGVKFPIFWAANFILDAINYIIPCLALMIVLIAFQAEDFITVEVQACVFVLFVLYGVAAIPQMYLFSFAFTVPSSGFTRMVMFNLFTGAGSILAVTILNIESLELLDVAEILDWVFMLLPQYNLGMGIINISTNSQLTRICQGLALFVCTDTSGNSAYNPTHPCCTKAGKMYLDWAIPGIGRNLLFLGMTGLVCFTVLFVAEAKIIEMIRFRRNKQVSAGSRTDDALEDSDVLAESARIRSTNLTQLYKTENLVLRDLTKTYGSFLAVDKLCLGVQHGECFGLLGVNGAGKTTTFKMLTGDHQISSGDAFIYSTSVKSDIKEVQKNLGYCPQFDAIIEELTGRETITLFARLRGIPENQINALVNTLAANLLFTEHIDKRCGAYSGGNKRKLSTAIALTGNPPLVFLDEPTTGMDPVARRHLWNAITKIRDAGTSIVLTSHSMEECEALCTRLSIMVNGKFRCLGPPQHLKNKFGEGYTLIAQISLKEQGPPVTRASMELGRRRSSAHANIQPWEKQLVPLRNYIEGVFPGAHLKDVHPGYLQYHIAATANITWGELFKKMEIAKSQFGLEAYSVGQTTLEQVFLNFTKAQLNGDE